MTAITPQPGIENIALYKGGDAAIAGASNVLKLSSNESPSGPGDAALEAYRRAGHSLNLYPSTDHAGLRAAIADVHGLSPERIICGNGSGEVLSLLAQAYAGPGCEIIMTEHGFSMYPIYAHASGATPVVVRERERTVDIEAVLAAVTDATRLIYLANPGNPTGTMISMAEIDQLASRLPNHVLLALDGAYAEFVEDYDGGAALVEARDNVVMTRTFSKLYGLGGLRIGWGYGPEAVIDTLNRIRGPFNLSATALATAEAAVRDTAHAEALRVQNARLRVWLAESLAALGVPTDTSMANFVLARFADSEEADAVDAHLRGVGIIVRRVAGYGLPHCLRITVGDEAACRRVVHAIAQFKAGS